jgi:hypothetical protein
MDFDAWLLSLQALEERLKRKLGIDPTEIDDLVY